MSSLMQHKITESSGSGLVQVVTGNVGLRQNQDQGLLSLSDRWAWVRTTGGLCWGVGWETVGRVLIVHVFAHH